MIQRVVGVIVLVLFAISLNIAVAWACVLWSPQRRATTIEREQISSAYLSVLPNPDDYSRVYLFRLEHFGYDYTQLTTERPAIEPGHAELSAHLLQWRAGWPWKFVMGEARAADMRAGKARYVWPRARSLEPLAVDSLRRLPYRPQAWGFAANVALYAGMTSALIGSMRAVRRSIRLRRHQCRACGYDLRASQDSCPECGALIGASPNTHMASLVK